MGEPTEAELRARYAPQLQAELQALAEEGAQTKADRAPVMLDQQSVGRLSRMDALQNQALAQAMEGRRAGRAKAIKAAIARIEAGDFGWCEDCGDFIGTARLDLDPTIPRCVACAR